jgi:hypothetical protein
LGRHDKQQYNQPLVVYLQLSIFEEHGNPSHFATISSMVFLEGSVFEGFPFFLLPNAWFLHFFPQTLCIPLALPIKI